MPFLPTPIAGLLIFEPKVWTDDRGYFFESYQQEVFSQAGIDNIFVQDNEAASTRGILRGLHYQDGAHAQAKLVRVVQGEVFDVAVDVRPDSSSYGQWYGLYLSAENKRQLFVPRGFAHGYLVTSETAIFCYKCDNFYHKASERGIRYDDPTLAIDWPELNQAYQLSEKDLALPYLAGSK